MKCPLISKRFTSPIIPLIILAVIIVPLTTSQSYEGECEQHCDDHRPEQRKDAYILDCEKLSNATDEDEQFQCGKICYSCPPSVCHEKSVELDPLKVKFKCPAWRQVKKDILNRLTGESSGDNKSTGGGGVLVVIVVAAAVLFAFCGGTVVCVYCCRRNRRYRLAPGNAGIYAPTNSIVTTDIEVVSVKSLTDAGPTQTK